MDFFIILKQTS